MKILDFMSFNVDWFLSTPGMLITGGVLLLLIALIILVTSGKKEEDADPTTDIANAMSNVELGATNNVSAQVEQPQINMPEVPVLEPVVPVSQPAVSQPVDLNAGIANVTPGVVNIQPSQPEVSQPVDLNAGIANVTPGVVNIQPSQPEVSQPVDLNAGIANVTPGVVNIQPSQPEVSQPVDFNAGITNVTPGVVNIQPSQPEISQPENSPILENNSVLQPEIASEPSLSVPNISEINLPDPFAIANENIKTNIEAPSAFEQPVEPVQQPTVSIYGGTSPTQDIFKPADVAKPVIYGGADPLENTGAIPKVEVAPVAEPTVSEVKVVEPLMSTTPISETAVVNNTGFSTVAMPQNDISQAKNDEVEELVF